MRNRSVAADVVLPHIVYQDLERAIEWLGAAFGFTEHYRYGDPPAGAQMVLGAACFMLRRARPGEASPAAAGCHTQSLTVFVDDVDAHYARTKAAGARVSEEPHETIYGEWQYGVEDLEGHPWLFSRHVRDVDPRSWGASVVDGR